MELISYILLDCTGLNLDKIPETKSEYRRDVKLTISKFGNPRISDKIYDSFLEYFGIASESAKIVGLENDPYFGNNDYLEYLVDNGMITELKSHINEMILEMISIISFINISRSYSHMKWF